MLWFGVFHSSLQLVQPSAVQPEQPFFGGLGGVCNRRVFHVRVHDLAGGGSPSTSVCFATASMPSRM